MGFVAAVLMLVTMLVNSNVLAVDKVIYGDDNRVDVVDSNNRAFVRLSASTAARVDNMMIVRTDDQAFLKGSSLADKGYCADDKFSLQIGAADCSGFLVSEDLLVTAGHCMSSPLDCSDYSWVFDYKVDQSGQVDSVNVANIYGCLEVIEQKLDPITKEDYALIRLDRKVSDRAPLEFRKTGEIEDFESLVIIGHPAGLPTKIADNANVRTNDNEFYFVANLDSFGGNSGSAVFNANTGMVEGVLVRGENDFNYDPENGCYRINTCRDDGCRGEDVTRITRIKALQSLSI